MNPDLVNNRHVCLVLSCQRPFYDSRRKANQTTFDILKECGFIVFYIVADNSITSIQFNQLATDEYIMTVPCPEMYELISYKMNLVYNYFNNTSCKGVLKIDDNTIISFSDIIKYDFMELTEKHDYIGLDIVHRSPKNSEYIYLKNRTQIPLFENIYHKLDIDMSYFGGPFYYISKKALSQVVKVGLVFSYEDLSVGYAICKNSALKRYTWLFKDRGISWDNLKEVEHEKIKRKI